MNIMLSKKHKRPQFTSFQSSFSSIGIALSKKVKRHVYIYTLKILKILYILGEQLFYLTQKTIEYEDESRDENVVKTDFTDFIINGKILTVVIYISTYSFVVNVQRLGFPYSSRKPFFLIPVLNRLDAFKPRTNYV